MSPGNNTNDGAQKLLKKDIPVPKLDSERYTLAGQFDKPKSEEIRQVAALIPKETSPTLAETSVQKPEVKPEVKPKDIATWKSPTPKLDSRKIKPTSIHSAVPNSTDSNAGSSSFDVIGKLGYFPNRPDGYPVYALVQEKNGQDAIVCFVEAESGEKLDRFVGKTIGIKGKKGWFRRENESRMMVTAKTIFSLKESTSN